jgi:hypothetical protein
MISRPCSWGALAVLRCGTAVVSLIQRERGGGWAVLDKFKPKQYGTRPRALQWSHLILLRRFTGGAFTRPGAIAAAGLKKALCIYSIPLGGDQPPQARVMRGVPGPT